MLEEKYLAVNVKASGKVHRLSSTSATQPREKWRARCGWWAGATKTMLCKRMVAGNLCRKCFHSRSMRADESDLQEAIEEFD